MNRFWKWLVIGLCMTFLTGMSLFYTGQEQTDLDTILRYANGEALCFDVDYEGDAISVRLLASDAFPADAEIRYTLDGSPPTEESPLYTGPLRFPADWSELPVIRALICCRGACTPIYTKTIPAEETVRFPAGMRILTVSTDPDCLYDYETGILIEGKTKDDYLATHTDYDELPSWKKPANFRMRGDDWIRPAHLQILDSDWTLLGEQDVGLSVSGGASAYLEIKSLRFAAKWADPENKDFPTAWAGLPTRAACPFSMAKGYNKLAAKNGGQDRDWSFLVTQSVYPRAVAAGLTATPDCVPAAVYLNGSFYSYAILQPHLNRDYLGNLYGLDKENIEYITTSENDVLRTAGVKSLLNEDPADPAARAKLEQIYDLDNLLLYYAFEMCCNNRDVLANNYGVWRWTGTPDPENPYTDGRFRFVLYDVDRAYFTDTSDAFYDILSEDGFIYSRLLAWILAEPARREQFVNICLGLANVTLDPELVTGEMDRLRALQQSWLENSQAGDLIAGSLAGTSEEAFASTRRNALNRKDVILEDLCSFFELSGARCTLELTGNAASSAVLEYLSLPLGRSWSLDWLADNPLTLRPVTGTGRRFSHWLVNGTEYREECLRLDLRSLGGERVTVELVTEPVEGPLLVVSEIDAKGREDWVELKNAGSEPLDLGGLYISNRENKPDQCSLPDLSLAPGETIVLLSKNNMSLLGYLMNFNLADEEHLYIRRADGSLLLDFAIPEMLENESYGLDPSTGEYIYYLVSSKGEENPTLFDCLNGT